VGISQVKSDFVGLKIITCFFAAVCTSISSILFQMDSLVKVEFMLKFVAGVNFGFATGG
jgi:hypothetical protein